jgi:formylglycine-generating enzyme required for sulfatase activity
MVRVSLSTDGASLVDFCIDSTEVTRAQYGQFLEAIANDPPAQPEECQSNTSFLAPVTDPPDHPVAYVDHCDAQAFCKWAGKRLCGSVQREPDWNPFSPLENEWFFACSNGGTRDFPYGNNGDPGACAFLDNAASGPVAVGTLPGCEGGFPGIFDMTGNVWEWIDSCVSGPDAGGMYCRFEGGSYKQVYENYLCGTITLLPPASTAPDIGIRCCASAQ